MLVSLIYSAVQIVAVTALAVKRQDNSQSLPAETVAQYQAFVSGFNAEGLVDNVFTSDFYATPSNFSESLEPGQVLKLQRVTNSSLERSYATPAGLSLWRMMYTSLDLFNKTVPASAFVLAPYLKSDRTVVWTHGTSGITRDCAPSNQRLLYYDFLGLFPLALQGYNVIGPDYAGETRNEVFENDY